MTSADIWDSVADQFEQVFRFKHSTEPFGAPGERADAPSSAARARPVGQHPRRPPDAAGAPDPTAAARARPAALTSWMKRSAGTVQAPTLLGARARHSPEDAVPVGNCTPSPPAGGAIHFALPHKWVRCIRTLLTKSHPKDAPGFCRTILVVRIGRVQLILDAGWRTP
jgi:hypothetical protein